MHSPEWHNALKNHKDWASFCTMKGHLQNWTQLISGKLTTSLDSIGESPLTLHELINQIMDGCMDHRYMFRIGAGRAGVVLRVVLGAMKLIQNWSPSIAVKISTIEPEEPLAGPFVGSRAEAFAVRTIFERIFVPKISPHVPIYYTMGIDAHQTVLATDFAQYGSLFFYLSTLLEDRTLLGSHLDAIIFQILYTLDVLQRMWPGFRHNDLHPRNILLRAHNFEGFTLYTTPWGTATLPNLGFQAIIADLDWVVLPNCVENFQLIDFFIHDPNYIDSAYSYEYLPGMDAYRFINSLQQYRDCTNLLRILMTHMEQNFDVEFDFRNYSPKDHHSWANLPPLSALLPLCVEYFQEKQPESVIRETFSSVSIQPAPFGSAPMLYDSELYVRILPTIKNCEWPSNILKAFSKASCLSNTERELPMAPVTLRVVQEWVSQDLLFDRGGTEAFASHVWKLYTQHKHEFNVVERFHIYCLFAIYAQTVLHTWCSDDNEFRLLALDNWSSHWAIRLGTLNASEMNVEQIMTAMQEVLYLWYTIAARPKKN